MLTRQRKQRAAVRHCGLHSLNAARYYPGVLLLLALAAPITATAGPIYDAFVGSIGGFYGSPSSGTIIGNGASGSGMNCSSGGPVPLATTTFSSGFSAPAGGVAPCNYFGGIIQNTGSTPQTAATGVVSGTFTSGGSAFQGNASASAGNSSSSSVAFGVQATAAFQGVGDGGGTLAETGAAAAIDDPNWTVTCPTCAAGATIYPTFTWSISSVDITSNPTAPNLGDFYLNLYSDLNHEYMFTDFEVDFNNGGPGSEPTVECLGTSDTTCPPGFTIYPGGFSGAITFTFAPDIAYQEVTLGVGNSATVDAQFAFTALAQTNNTIDPGFGLTGVSWENGFGAPISGVTLTTSNGIYADGVYTAFSSSTPEPASWLLCALGVGAVAMRRFHTGRSYVESPGRGYFQGRK
jgi:hypothetical protein